jgi:hypothetical protein
MIRRPTWMAYRAAAVATALLALLAAAGCGNRLEVPADPRADHIAAYLAGTDLPESSSLHGFTLFSEYGEYRKGMDKSWAAYRANALERMRMWSARHMDPRRHRTVFYPFSGPDIITPMEFYPDADEYIMVGLEPPGRLTDPRELGRARAMAELQAMRYSLHTLMKLNYFRTVEMRKELDPVGFNNISNIMMFFIKRSGRRVLGVRMIHLESDGGVIEAPGAQKETQGIEVVFENTDGSGRKRARYLLADLSNAGLSKSPFMKFMARQGRVVTFMKSAAYLAGLDRFSAIRDFMLAKSDYIVQDDAGIPVRFLDETKWRCSFYGSYRVLAQFRRFYQPDLERKMRERNGGPLDFDYGYGYTPAESHIITARRR